MKIYRPLHHLIVIVTILIVTGSTVHAVVMSKLDNRLIRSSNYFESVMSSPESSIPVNLLREARGIILLRGYKGGFIFAVKGADGVALVRDQLTGSWSAPAFLKSGEGSFGLQAGGSKTDTAILLMSKSSLRLLNKSKFQIGIDVGATAGNIGAEADAKLGLAQIVVYNNVDGIYAGVSLEGGFLKPDNRANALYHNRAKITLREILFEDKGVKTQAAHNLIDLIDKFTKSGI